jgi:hypothetical protein
MHEYTHHVYHTFVNKNTFGTALDESYSIYFPCSIHNNSKYSLYLNPADPKDIDSNFQGENNSFAIAAAFWDIRKELGQYVTDRLIFYSWHIQPISNYPNGTQALVSLAEADWQIYNGQHNSVIKEQFKNHGIVCETCLER